MRLRLAIIAALCVFALPFAVQAEQAHTAKTVHLRAGPARDYPVVAVLPPQSPLDVLGCLSDYSWCDVVALDINERGWVYAGNIEGLYEGNPVPLIEYGPALGIAVVPFVLDDYWGLHYRHRPWYPDRDHWIHTPRPVQPPLPPDFGPPRPKVPQPPPGTMPPAPPSPPARPPEGRIPPPRSAEPGRPPVTGGDVQPRPK
jgi:uncharacterized protein YraI